MLDIRKTVHTYLPNLETTLPKPVFNLFIRFLQKLLHEKRFLEIHKRNHYLKGLDFVDSMLENLNIDYTVKSSELKNIPSTGKVIIIANHPTGAQDTLSLVQVVANVRENKKVKFLSVPVAKGIKQIEPLLITVDNVNGSISKESLKQTYEMLKNDEALIIFPAGIVSRLTWKGIKDTVWKSSFLKIAQRSQTPIVPIKIEARNSILFYTLSLFLPNKITAMLLPHEFATASTKPTLHFKIGKVIPASSFSDKTVSTESYLKRFYKHVYNIGSKKQTLFQTETTIEKPQNRQTLKNEVDNARCLGYTNNQKRIIFLDGLDTNVTPLLMRELGRVREISFRAVGAGTSTEIDIDLYDSHYQHLILWDDDDLEIVGGYRLGECHKIIPEKGINGMYNSKFCHFSDEFSSTSKHCIELGRSFVQPKYWGSRAFDSLWQAVTVYLAHNPHIQYSYGIVTIAADTPQKAVAALVYFYTSYFSSSCKMMSAKSPYVMSYDNQKEFEALFADLEYKEGLVVLKSYLKEMGTVIPTLFKQYIELYEPGAVEYFDFSVHEAQFGMTGGFIRADNYKMKKSIQDRNLKNFYESQNVDPVTGVYSRKYFEQYRDTIAKRYHRREDAHCFTSIIHIDNFDQIVKEFGSRSNEALQKVAKVLENNLRENDVIAKYDESSFIILIQGIEISDEPVIINKLHEALAKLQTRRSMKITALIDTKEHNYIKEDHKPKRTLRQANTNEACIGA